MLGGPLRASRILQFLDLPKIVLDLEPLEGVDRNQMVVKGKFYGRL